MPEERIGTKVELDIKGALKGYDELIDRLKKTDGAWREWVKRVEKAYPTLDKIQKIIKANTDRLNELRFSSKGVKKAAEEEMRARRALAAGLKEILGDYRAQEAAVKAQARAQERAAQKAVQAQKAQQRAADATTRAQERQGKSTSRNLKKMLLWGIGAASAYRLFMQLRRAIEEAAHELYGNTEEWKRTSEAIGVFKKSLLLAIIPQEDFLVLLDQMAQKLDIASEALIRHGATRQAIGELVREAQEDEQLGLQLLIATGRAVGERNEQLTVQALVQSRVSEIIKDYNRLIEESGKKTEEATKKQAEVAKAYERYQQRLYRITETRLQGLLQAHKAYYDALADMALEDTRRAEDLAIETARRREDWARDAARRRAALLRQYNKQILRVEMSYWRAARRLAEDRARRLLQIERRYRDRLLDIERAYSYSMYEAIAARDATAALRAMRKRRDDLADAKRDRDRARADVEADYLRRLRELQENLEEQRRRARKSYEEALEELNCSLREQEEDLAISLRRREEDAELSRKRQLQDLKLSLAKQMRAVIDQYNRDRRLATIEYRYREDAFARHLARMRAIALAYQAALRPPATPTGRGGGVQRFAEGGAMVVTRPTMALFGERGAELVIAQPLPPTPQSFMVSGSVRHEVSTIIQQSMAGFEGRIAGAVHSALSEVIR